MAAEATSVAAAAEQTGVPESTLRYWMDDPKFAELRAKSQEERAEGFRVLSLLAIQRLSTLVDQMEPRDLIVLAGVATEKAQLLSGHATSRSETREATAGLADHEKVALRDAIDGWLAGRSESVP